MRTLRHPHHFPSHLLATLTGCVLMLACSAGEANAANVGSRPDDATLTRSLTLDGALQGTFRKLRHLVSFFIDSDQPLRQEQHAPGIIPAAVVASPAYGLIFGHNVKHVRNRQIRSWLLRE